MSVGAYYEDYVNETLRNFAPADIEYVIAVGTYIKSINDGYLIGINREYIDYVVKIIPGYSLVSDEKKLDIITMFTSDKVNYLNYIFLVCNRLKQQFDLARVARRQVKPIGYTATDYYQCNNMRKRQDALNLIEQHSLNGVLYTGSYNYEDCSNNTQRDSAFDEARRRNEVEYAKRNGKRV